MLKYHIEARRMKLVLNYTSGQRPGFSKGVMIPYRSLWSNTRFAYTTVFASMHPGDNIVCNVTEDGAHVRVWRSRVLNSVNAKELPRSFPDTHAEVKTIVRGICDRGSTGAGRLPCRSLSRRRSSRTRSFPNWKSQ
ncbi:MAG: hypothetical protein ACLR6J_15385 [Parabacteroides merdae]